MSKLAHSSDYHMALIDAQSMINDGFSKHALISSMLSSAPLTNGEMADVILAALDMKRHYMTYSEVVRQNREAALVSPNELKALGIGCMRKNVEPVAIERRMV